MSDDIILPVRKSLRLKHYNYSNPGLYFITLCAQKKANLFWSQPFSGMNLNSAGTMLQHWLDELEKAFLLSINCSTIMPNHVHVIIQLFDIDFDRVGADLCVRPPQAVSTNVVITRKNPTAGGHTGPPLQDPTANVPSPSIPAILQWFKTMSTNAYIRGVKSAAYQPFNGLLWQRSFYDHVIRSEKSLENIRTYIINNPLKWDQDAENSHVKLDVKKYYDDLLL
jgi:REP element-mobilizing transposase RayT